MAGSILRNPSLYWAVSILTLLSGASLVYISIKAPFFWGFVYIPGVILVNVWAISAIIGTILALQRRGVSE
jgi:hypothetical protein